MEYRKLGKSGLPVSAVGFGTWITFGNQIDSKTAKELLITAYDAGINFFDNAEVYAHGRSEEVMGDLLQELAWGRDTYSVTSKAFFGAGGQAPTQKGLHRKHLVEACNAALRRLKVDYLDVYYCHRPDKSTPIEETVWTMHQLIQQGKILYWGTSEWSAAEIMEAHMFARQYGIIGPVVEQPQYNLLHRDKVEVEYATLYDGVGLGLTTWSPLASGILTGKYRLDRVDDAMRLQREELAWLKERNVVEEKLKVAQSLAEFAAELGMTPAQLSIAWSIANARVSCTLLGATRVEQLKENLKALQVLPQMTPEVLERIEQIVQNKPVPPAF